MRLGFVLEHSLGHTTHAHNLKSMLGREPHIQPTIIDLPFEGTLHGWGRLPGVRSNWTLRASLYAYFALRSQARDLQAALFHTQVTSLFCTGLMRRLPAVISLDATPLQYDTLGQFYGHRPSTSSRIEAIKMRLNLRAFAAARHLVTWSQWTKDSLVSDYGVPAEKITVIPPGIDTDLWGFPQRFVSEAEPVRLLFVGGDFERKGGNTLLASIRRLPRTVNVQLDIVTKATDLGKLPRNVRVHHNIAPNSEALLNLFRQADLFVFPTRGDCLPLAIMEALAAGLPVITTNVGALPEAVVNGETGLIVPPDDPQVLAEAITLMAIDPDWRRCLGLRAREVALERFQASTNYQRLLALVQSTVCA